MHQILPPALVHGTTTGALYLGLLRTLLFMNRHLSKKHPVLEEFRLPTEILVIIINQVASETVDNDRTLAALASCRLASYVLCSLATPFFFSSIRLTDSVVAPLASRKKIFTLLSLSAATDKALLSMLEVAYGKAGFARTESTFWMRVRRLWDVTWRESVFVCHRSKRLINCHVLITSCNTP